MHTARIALTTTLFVALSSAGFAQEEAATEPPGWTGKVALGGSLNSGTTDSFSGNISATGEREWDANLVRLDLRARYGKTKQKYSASVIQNNEQVLKQYYRRSVSKRFYVYGETEESRDGVRNIELRFFATAGPGYKAWIGEDGAFLDLEAGIGYRYEDYGNVFDPSPGPLPGGGAPGGDGIPVVEKSRNDVTGRAAFVYKNKLGPADFGQSGEFLLPFNDTHGWIARAETKLSFPVLESWSFENSLGMEYFNEPPSGSDKFELDYIVSLVYAF